MLRQSLPTCWSIRAFSFAVSDQISGKCWHHLAREQIDALIRIHVAEDDREEGYSPADALVQVLDKLSRGAFDPSTPEGKALRHLPLLVDLGLIRADTDQQLLRDVNLIQIAAHGLAVLLKHVKLVLEIAVTSGAVPAVCVFGDYPHHELFAAAADRDRRMRLLDRFGTA